MCPDPPPWRLPFLSLILLLAAIAASIANTAAAAAAIAPDRAMGTRRWPNWRASTETDPRARPARTNLVYKKHSFRFYGRFHVPSKKCCLKNCYSKFNIYSKKTFLFLIIDDFLIFSPVLESCSPLLHARSLTSPLCRAPSLSTSAAAPPPSSPLSCQTEPPEWGSPAEHPPPPIAGCSSTRILRAV